jgi:hypothetical protein
MRRFHAAGMAKKPQRRHMIILLGVTSKHTQFPYLVSLSSHQSRIISPNSKRSWRPSLFHK